MFYAINHKIGIKASPEEIFKALTETEKLSQWWTSDIRGSGSMVGDTLEFRFGDFSQKLEVMDLTPGKQVEWKAHKEGMDEWDGTEITFTLCPQDTQTFLNFKHSKWQKDTGSFPHCSMKWATFLLSFKDLMETGKGKPYPDDLQINHS